MHGYPTRPSKAIGEFRYRAGTIASMIAMKRFEEVQDWQGFLNALRADDRIVFRRMLTDLEKYAEVIGQQENPAEAMIITILLQQHKIIKWLETEIQKLKAEKKS
ncbi:MAG: hypothetical protein V3T40_03760 [Nitrososphaerales archaeon]